MAQTRLRRAIEAVKDHSSIGLAKVNNRASVRSDLDVAILRATKHDEYPGNERHINAILGLTSFSTPYVCACVKTISRRLRKTKNWVVALKTLMLIHRLLRDGNVAFQQQFFFTTRYGTCLLDMSDFQDKTRLDSWDYSTFVRTYALYLNDQLLQKVKARKSKDASVFTSRDAPKEIVKLGAIVIRVVPVKEMKMEQIFTRIYCLMETFDLFLNCRPTGSATTNRLVVMALCPVTRESFVLYNDITEIVNVLMGRFMELDISESIKVHEILCRISKQLNELDVFYDWIISSGVARSSLEVVKIPQTKLEEMEKHIQEKTVEEKSMNSIKALPLHEKLPEETEEKEIGMKIYEVSDLINWEEDDPPTTEEHPDKLALSLFDGAPAKASPCESFNDMVDWETELEQSAIHLSNEKETPTGGFGTMIPKYGMYQQGSVNHKEGNDGSIGMPAMLALPAPPSQNDATTIYANYAAPMEITLPPYVHMSETEMKQRLPIEHHVMWQQYSTGGMRGPVAYAMTQPYPYMYNQGGCTKTY